MLKCGHFFCLKCIKEHFTDEEGIKCPNDGLVALSIKELKILNNLITDKNIPSQRAKKETENENDDASNGIMNTNNTNLNDNNTCTPIPNPHLINNYFLFILSILSILLNIFNY